MNIKATFIAIAVGLLSLMMTGCGGGGTKVDRYQSTVKRVIDGNTIELASGLKVKLLGVAPGHTSTEAFMSNNNLVGQKVMLMSDQKKNKKPLKFKKNKATVEAYVYLKPSNKCLNGMILRQCALADNTVYSENHMLDSIPEWRPLFEGCNHEGTLPDIGLYMKQRTFLIQTPEGLGTGFFINENGLALTNCHVLPPHLAGQSMVCMYADNPDDSKLYTEKTRGIRRILKSSDPNDKDITIFAVDLLEGEKVPYFHLSKQQAPVGKHVQTFGNPGAGSGAVYTAKYSDGTIGSYMNDAQHGRPNMDLVTYNIDTNPGNSGGPVCLDNGLVIAVHDMGERGAQGLNAGINILQVRQMLDAINADYFCK